MPLTPGSNVSDTIRELHKGNTFKRTAAKFGVGDARRQAVAIALSNAGKARAAGGMVRGYDLGGGVIPQMGIMPPQPPGMMPAGMVLNQFNPGLNTPMGVAPSSPMPMAAPSEMPPSMVPPPGTPPVPTGLSQPPSPMGTTPNNPMARPLMARGGALHRAGGGFDVARRPNLTPSWEQKQEAHGMMHVGPISSIVPGRTDNHRTSVPSGSYVLPAAHISSMGQGNTGAGLAMAHSMFGVPDMPIKHGSGAPRPPRPPRLGMLHTGGTYSEGGAHREGYDHPVPVMLSGGEYVIAPKVVRRIGKGSLKNGHKILDSWVMSARKKEVETLRNLPPPAKK